MVATCKTVAFRGIEPELVRVECQISDGLPGFAIVGLPDKAVSEARERIRSVLMALRIALPTGKVTVNLSPADLPKAGGHYDLPIALALIAALDMVPRDAIRNVLAMGELSLDGGLIGITGALPAALAAAQEGLDLLCPAANGAEAGWIGSGRVFAATDMPAVIGHFGGGAPLDAAAAGIPSTAPRYPDMADVQGQPGARRALEIAAAGGHPLLMVGPPGAGKSMLAKRLPGLLPPMAADEVLETGMIHSVAGQLPAEGLSAARPFLEPHHTASSAAIIGGGRQAGPGQISLAHNGVLFLDELPEFPRMVLETLRQPLETGSVVVARANAHMRYPCRFQLIAAANPCRCGYLADPDRACAKAPVCGADYLAKISGPLLDRLDLRIEVPAVPISELRRSSPGESSAVIAARVAAARSLQRERYQSAPLRLNAEADGPTLNETAALSPPAADLLERAADKFRLTARGYFRVIRVGRSIADLEQASEISDDHIAEALSYRISYAG